MLTENLAGKTFPLKSCMHGGIAQSVRSSSDYSSPISQPANSRGCRVYGEVTGK